MNERKTYNGSTLDNDLTLECDVVIVGTGAGGGGYILSLWKSEPPKDLLDQMVELQF